MDLSATLTQIKALPVEDRLQLVQAIWASIEADQGQAALTESQRLDLDRRMAELDAHPDNVLTWDQIKSRVLDRP